MQSKEILYSNGEITVIWRPEFCQQAGICVKMLPKVYNPSERPWVKIGNASTEELVEQLKSCPSGALSFFVNKGVKENAGR